MKSTALILCAVLTLAAFVIAQSPTLTALPNTVFVGADGKFETAPDTAMIQFNISAQADTRRARSCAPTESIPNQPRSVSSP